MRPQIRILLCDDDQGFLEYFEALLEAAARPLHAPVQIIACQEAALAFAVQDEIHIAFLDVEMPGPQDGLHLADYVAQRYPNALIVFVTSHDKYMKPAFKVHPFEYINKAQLEEELPAVLKSAVTALGQRGYVYIRDKRGLVPTSQILYLQSDAHYIWIHFADGPPAMEKGTVKGWVAKLGKAFFMCHQRFIVNLQYLAHHTGNEVILANGQALPLSRRQKGELKGAINQYLDAFGRYV